MSKNKKRNKNKVSSLTFDKEKVLNKGYEHNGPPYSGWDYSEDSPDSDILDNLEAIRGRSRDLYMTTDLAVAVMEKYRTKVVGIGLVPKPMINYKYLGISKEKAKEMEQIITTKFEAWASSTNCDSTRVHDFYTLQGLAVISYIMNGDVFCVIRRKETREIDIELCLQLVEGDRVKNPDTANENTKLGIEFKNNELYKYHISSTHPGDGKGTVKGYPVFNSLGRRNILHLFEPNRVGQKRGIPVLAPVLKNFKQLERYKSAELMSALINATVAMVLESDNPGATLNIGHVASSMGKSLETPAGGSEALKRQVATVYGGGGTVFATNKKEKLTEFKTERPNKNFKDFVDTIVKELGAATMIPSEVITSSFQNSYSASRAALEEAEARFKTSRKLLERKICHPIYEEFIIELIRNGDVECKGFFEDATIRHAFSKCMWIGANKTTLDPLKDAKSAEVLIKNGILPKSIVVSQMGLDSDSVATEIREEKIKSAELDNEIAKIRREATKNGMVEDSK